MAAEQYNKHWRTYHSRVQRNATQLTIIKPRLSYLDVSQKLRATLPDIFKGTPSGEHEDMGQDVIQIVAWRTP